MKLLLTGDLHLGRTSSRLPARKREEARTLSGWERLVEAALSEPVDAVLLSGDVLDEDNAFWESVGPLQAGVERLAAAGIRTVAVAGNHDADILPRLAAALPREAFTLLGAGGTWERETLVGADGSKLHVDGWSFPAKHVREDPTGSFPSLPRDGIPVLGMVHGDPGNPASDYAPLSLSKLQALPVDGWLLGHIHVPKLTSGSPWILMPGSPQPLDPGEAGPHQAWLLETGASGLPEPTPFCPSALRYRSVEIPVTAEDPPGPDTLLAAIQEAVAAEGFDGFQILRVLLTGFSEDPEALEDMTETLTEFTHPNACVEAVKIRTRPPLHLDSLQGSGPVPSRLVEALGAVPEDLQARLDTLLREVNRRREFSGHDLPPLTLDDLEVNSLLEQTLRGVVEVLHD